MNEKYLSYFELQNLIENMHKEGRKINDLWFVSLLATMKIKNKINYINITPTPRIELFVKKGGLLKLLKPYSL